MPLLTSAYEQALVGLHHQLSDEEFTAAWDAGRAMTLDELLDLSAMPPAAPARAKARVSDNAGLSTREMEVLRLLVAGHSDRQIAETLYISHRTAQGHVGSIFNKLGVNSRTAAATTAIRLGLVSDAADRYAGATAGERPGIRIVIVVVSVYRACIVAQLDQRRGVISA